jgi:hypothetical protein
MKDGPVLKLRAQHACFVSEQEDMVVTVYSRSKKSLNCGAVNWALDMAKAELHERARAREAEKSDG